MLAGRRASASLSPPWASPLLLSCVVLFLMVTVRVLAISDVVQTTSGPVRGVTTDVAFKFLGIPFAEPPVGDLRFADPVPHHSWAPSVLNAVAFSPGCPQKCQLPPMVCPNATSEDCLTLNVFVPREQSGPLPVMVYLPGGRFEQGAAGVDLYDAGTVVNSTGVVIVTTNYRFGALGYVAIDGLGSNFGLKDQLLALKWVQDNIAAFGGDPKQVTLFGQSAGATSSAVLLSMPQTEGLFSKVIIQSNPFSLLLRRPDSAHALAEYFVKALGCDMNDVTCLRSKSSDEIVAAEISAQQHIPVAHPLESFLPWTPVVDGTLVTDQPLNIYKAGKGRKLPLMMGSVTDEAYMFVWQAWNKTVSKVEFDAIIVGIFREHALGVLDLYGHKSDGDQRPLFARLGTDYIFLCPSRSAAWALADPSTPVYLYRFNHTLSFPGAWGPRFWYCYTGVVCHGSEVPFVFHSHAPFDWEPEEEALSLRMVTYWTNFAKTGSPNVGAPVDVQWPNVADNKQAEMLFSSDGDTVEQGYRSSYCDVWDKWGYSF